MAATRIKLFYDVVSPYSWIAFEVMCRYRVKWNINLEFCPFLLGGIMNISGNRPPGLVPLKGKYSIIDLQRLSEFYQIPLNPPKNVAEVMFEKGSLWAQRLLLATKELCPNKVEELSRQLWLRIWSRDQDIIERDSLIQACQAADISNTDIENLLIISTEQPIKDKLKANTQEAIEYGAFGSPYMVAYVNSKPQPFFGTDRFEVMANIIGEKWEGPLIELRAKY